MKKLILIAVSLLFVFGFFIAGVYYWWHNQLVIPAVKTDVPAISYVVLPGQSNSVTIDQLFSKHYINSKLAAKIYLRLHPEAQKILPGNYIINIAYMPMPQIFELLTAGPKDIQVTLPEGWRREQMAVRLHDTISTIDPVQFIADTADLEGQLFPDTYLMPALATSSDAISILKENFFKKTKLDTNSSYDIVLDGKTHSLTGREILIFASLVEREAKAEADRPIIAGIILRRFWAEWPLQIDASLQYAAGTQRCQSAPFNCDYWQPISDTKIVSAYNTYTHPGLPPAPIANAGLSVIQSVLHPKDSPYWYYLTGNDGVTYYARTLPEHNLNVDKHL